MVYKQKQKLIHIICKVLLPFVLRNRQSIAHKPEPIGTSVVDEKVFRSEGCQHLPVMVQATGIHGSHLTVRGPSFIPGAAATAPCHAFQEFLAVRIVVVCCILADLNGPVHSQL